MASQHEPTRSGPTRIQLADDLFEQLAAGGGGPEVIARLQDGQRSRRMVLLRALLGAAAEDPLSAGPLPSVADAWSALERIQEQAPAAVQAVLQHPQVGAWLSFTLRRHRGGTVTTAPAHIDFGQLNTVALAAAALARLTHRTRVPLRDGRVLVPRFGMAVFAGCAPWDVAEAWTEGGRIFLRHGEVTVAVPESGDAPGWLALREVTVGDVDTFTVHLDDLDPWRDLADPVGPARLSDTAFAVWVKLLQDAWTILIEHHRPTAVALAARGELARPVAGRRRLGHPQRVDRGRLRRDHVLAAARPGDPGRLAGARVHAHQARRADAPGAAHHRTRQPLPVRTVARRPAPGRRVTSGYLRIFRDHRVLARAAPRPRHPEPPPRRLRVRLQPRPDPGSDRHRHRRRQPDRTGPPVRRPAGRRDRRLVRRRAGRAGGRPGPARRRQPPGRLADPALPAGRRRGRRAGRGLVRR